ncbi:MAG: alpha/beta hydrolase [Sedimentisphaerales bacterium]
MASMLLDIIVLICLAYLGLGLFLYYMQSRFLYEPVRQIPYTPAELGLNFEEVYFKTGDRFRLHGWFVPAPNAQFTVLYCHGNGGNMMYFLDTVNFLNKLGLNCFVFDYRGYGESQGAPSENGTYLDARAAYRWLTKKKGVAPQQIILFGWSLGGSIAAYLATKFKSAALVIESAFTSYPAIGQKFYPYMPVKWFARFDYPAIEYVRKVTCPVLVIHSRNDEIIPFELGLKIYDAANEPKKFVEIFGKHNDCLLISGETYKKAWTNWLTFLKESTDIENTRQKSV